MQLKGLVRFFTILLIVYSIYQLSFTWLIRSHERKLEASAKSYIAHNFKTPEQQYPGNQELQGQWQDSLDKFYKERLQRLKDSTRDVTLSYGPAGKISYHDAKQNELNLGLDLQGGINVTLEVEMRGLLESMSNKSKDPMFLKALDNANQRKANSSANFITLFVEEYKRLSPNGRLAAIFANGDKIKVTDSDDKVISALRKEADDAFGRTYRVLRTRIDQFGVAQPNINPDADRGIISVELPGIQDQDRVRRQLQSSANLQFWELYSLADLVKNGSYDKAVSVFSSIMSGKKLDTTSAVDTSAAKRGDTTNIAKANVDTSGKNKKDSSITAILKNQNTNKVTDTTKANANVKSLDQWISFNVNVQNNSRYPSMVGAIGRLKANDSAIIRKYLELPAMKSQFPYDLVWMYGMPENDADKKANIIPIYAIKTNGKEKAKLEGDAIVEANQDYGQQGTVEVEMRMNNHGSKIWAQMTKDAAGLSNDENDNRSIAIALDNIVYSAPRVSETIEGGNSRISGNFTVLEAQDLANLLKSGRLPAPAKIVQEQVVGPTLGRDAVNGGLKAFTISFIVIFLLMLIYYNTSGWVANIALILNLLFTIGVLTGLGATLTAPGIAGLVLTIGMAVDTNVIIYERIKEELTKGKGYIPAVNEGYRRSLPPVLDAHVTTLLTAIILFYFGLGPVKGFATTQILGILLSLFCGILVSRWVTDWFTDKKRHLEYFTGISRKIFKHANFKFIEYRKIAYGISLVVLALGIGAIFNGFDEGVEFEGGRSFQIRFAQNLNGKAIEGIRDDLKKTFGEAPVIKTVGDNKTLDITTSYLIADTRQEADSLVEGKLYQGLQPHLTPGLSYSKFDAQSKIGSKKVLPTISDDLKEGAKKAVVFALMIISLYIFIRFRDWRYSLGTIVALLHDVLVTLAVFSFARKIVPFPLEIDQHFIAAILTVVGFSMNDTVIVFDRIREYSRTMVGATKQSIINRAINDTLSRTIMTSLTVFLTILILFLVGGEVTRGFAFAMLVGVITGTYSSVFVAAPILVDLARKKPLGKADTVVETKAKTGMMKPKTVKP